MVRCKFKCTDKTDDGNGSFIKMEPVYSGSEENEKFFRLTPFGFFDMGTINPEVALQFVEGEEYYIDISKATI